MLLFFEEDGSFKAGSILRHDGPAWQVELPTGRRTKVKGGHVFFEFEGSSASSFMEEAVAAAAEIDPGFLWEVSPGEEFSYEDVAEEYFGGAGPVEKAAVLIALHSNPVYFYRKGRGRYRSAPEDILKRALETIEKRRRLEERRKEIAAMMAAGKLPEEISAQAYTLLLHPDKNGMEWKALSDACLETRKSPLRLLLSLGAVKSPWTWHVRSFYLENFPRGTGFPADLPAPPAVPEDLPLSEAPAFSIDDSRTTEIDDAASLLDLGNGTSRIGIHIAAPALLIPRDSPVDLAARARMTTVYAPEMKTTMLPEEWIKAASLDAGRTVPCVSLYVTVNNGTMEVLSTQTCVDRVHIRDNLRYDLFESEVTEEAVASGTLSVPYAREICFLWRFAKAREKVREETRGKPFPKGFADWYFELDGEGEEAVARLRSRVRGAPIDLLVAELMIFANSAWGLWLEERGIAGIYRSQRMGKVRMSTSPGAHDGLGVERYAWSSSPLRRYVDLVNQRQIIAAVTGTRPPYMGNDADFFTIVSQFDERYTVCGEFQRRMERYWSLRWIMQEGLDEVAGTVIKGDLVRIDGLPLMQRIPGLPELPRGQRVLFTVICCDLVDLVLETKLKAVLEESGEIDPDELAEIEQAEEKKAEAGPDTRDGRPPEREAAGEPSSAGEPGERP